MNATIGYSEMLLEDMEGEEFRELREDAGRIHSAGKHLLSLINDVLDLSKIEAGKFDIVPEWIEILPLSEEVISSIRPQLTKKNSSIKLTIEEGLEPVSYTHLTLPTTPYV